MFKMKLIVVFVLLITMCTGVAGATWTSSIHIIVSSTSNDANFPPSLPDVYVCTFGVDDNATDGFDRDYDVTVPPAPQVEVLDAYFPCSHEVVTRLSTDMKADVETITWTLKMTVPSDSAVSMNWDTSNVPSDKMLVMNTGSSSINMKTQSSTIFETGSYTLFITSSKVVYTMQLQKGWNLVSTPLNPYSNVTTLFESNNDVILPVYSWNTADKRYYDINTIKIGKGYWILALNDTQVTFAVEPYSG